MTVRARLMIASILGLAVAMAAWGWVQLKALEDILDGQVGRKLQGIAETLGTYYQHFPTRKGLSALDNALRDHLMADVTLARIDIFTLSKGGIDYVAGAGRLAYEWPERLTQPLISSPKPRSIKIETDGGPALGLLYPLPPERDKKNRVCIGVVAYSQANAEILSGSRSFMILTSAGLLLFILLFLALSYGWLIGRPLRVIIGTIDESRKGKHVGRIPMSRRDEWGQLADHYNSMAVEIESAMAKNQELNRELETRVQEATLKVVQLQKQVNQLQQLTAMGYLTATLAHDLGTPLHSIAGMTKLLLERDGWPADVSRKLELIVQQTQRLDRVIQNVRRATRLPEPHFESVPVQQLLNETLPLAEPMTQKSGIRLDVQIEPGIPPLYVDRYRLQTALFNLIQNAVEAMPGGGTMTVSAFSTPNRQAVAVTVQDSGAGIPPELMEKIFEPFFSTRAEEGIKGLGLSIVQDIVKVHGAHMEIRSEPGAGTEFTLYFPIAGDIPRTDASDPFFTSP
jgi:two-component system NtrC family sensor kinase